MITTPEIERLMQRQAAFRNEARKIGDRLYELRQAERSRIREAKQKNKDEEARVKWQDMRSVVDEMHRLRILLAKEMRANGAKREEIEKVIGVGVKGLRTHRLALERLGILPRQDNKA